MPYVDTPFLKIDFDTVLLFVRPYHADWYQWAFKIDFERLPVLKRVKQRSTVYPITPHMDAIMSSVKATLRIRTA
jgi:hypothetical protein